MKKVPFVLYLVAGFLVILISSYGYYLYTQRIGFPPEIKQYYEKNQVVQIDDIKIKTVTDDEFILSRRKAGESATFYIKTDEGIVKKQGTLVPFYSETPYPVINLIVGLLLFIMGFGVFLLRPQEFRVRLFYWVSLAFACAQSVNGGFYCMPEKWFTFIPSVSFFISYALVGPLLLHFSLTFYRHKLKVYNYLIYIPAAVFIIILEYVYFRSILESSIEIYWQYYLVFIFYRCLIVSYLIASFLFFILGYKRAHLKEQKAQIKWVLYGLLFGVGPFIVLYQIPLILFRRSFITEEFAGTFFILIPLALAISIIRHRLMNIQLIINRSLVYSLLTIFTVGFYLLFVQIVQRLFSRLFPIQQVTISVIGAFAVALAFDPARKKIQDFVDRSFFRVSYDYKKSILSFNERAHKIARQPHLVDFFLMKVDKTIPLEYIGLRVFSVESGKRKVLIEKGESDDLSTFDAVALRSSRIYARRKSVLTELGMNFSIEKLLEEKNVELVIPMPFRTTALAGFFALGKKKSGTKFSGDDIELLLTMAETFALNLERIHLQEEVIYERAEKEKFDELNRLKTEFISNVSHEIRTPMSSIQGMSEILQQGKIKGEKKQEEILEAMTNECGRLSRFLHNILDYGKIEMEMKSFHFQKTDISQVVENILRLYAYRFQSLGFSVKKKLPKDPVWLDVDPDAVKQALTNLIDNAIKYSTKKREIAISVVENQKDVTIRVQDWGIGIPEKERRKIFEGFYRSSDAERLAPKGVGLGLKIVKNIMEAHGGEIQVHSEKGKGSTFSLIFPR